MDDEPKNHKTGNPKIDWQEIDCLGLKCPLPVMQLERAVAEGYNDILIITDDPISVIDIPLALTKMNGQLLNRDDVNNAFHFFLKFQQEN